MRSRYSAFAVGDVDHLRRTWHPTTRPADLDLDPAVRWTRLDVLDVRGGGRDRVDCGDGRDRIKVDGRDRVRNCERVR